MKYLLLLLVVLFPQMYDNNTLLLKTFFIMACGVLWLDPDKIKNPQVPADVWRLLKVMFVIAAVGLVSSLYAPLWKIAIFGCDGRVEGLIPAIALGLVAWLGFWAYDKKPNLTHYVRVMQVITFVSLGVLLCHRNLFYQYTVTDMGIGMMIPQFIPLMVVVCCLSGFKNKFDWISLGCALWLVALSGSRSGMIAIFIGLAVAAIFFRPAWCNLSFKQEAWRKGLSVAALLLVIAGVALSFPGMRGRILSIDPSSLGDGPRSYVIMRLLESGTPLFGYGFGQQRLIIGDLPMTCTEARGFEWDRWFNAPAFYDRFHVWIFDAISDVGTFGFGMILVGLFFVFRTAWQNRENEWVAGFAGSLAAFIAVCLFNPPSTTITFFGALSAAGIYLYSKAPMVGIKKTHRIAWCFLVLMLPWYGVMVYRNFMFCIEWISLSRIPVSQ
jgi:hypothetical protein